MFEGIEVWGIGNVLNVIERTLCTEMYEMYELGPLEEGNVNSFSMSGKLHEMYGNNYCRRLRGFGTLLSLASGLRNLTVFVFGALEPYFWPRNLIPAVGTLFLRCIVLYHHLDLRGCLLGSYTRRLRRHTCFLVFGFIAEKLNITWLPLFHRSGLLSGPIFRAERVLLGFPEVFYCL